MIGVVIPTLMERPEALCRLLSQLKVATSVVSIVVVAPNDRLQKKLFVDPKIHYLGCDTLGACYQRNMGARWLTSNCEIEVLAFIDDDMVIVTQTLLESLADSIISDAADLVGPRIIWEDLLQAPTSAGRNFLSTGLNYFGLYPSQPYSVGLSGWHNTKQPDEVAYTEWLPTGLLFVRAEIINEAMLFCLTETGYSYLEDIEFTHRCFLEGRRLLYRNDLLVETCSVEKSDLMFGIVEVINRFALVRDLKKSKVRWAIMCGARASLTIYIAITQLRSDYYYRFVGNLIGLKRCILS